MQIWAIHISNFKNQTFFNEEIILKVIKVGIPMALQNSFIALSLIALQRVVNEFGSDFITSYTIAKELN